MVGSCENIKQTIFLNKSYFYSLKYLNSLLLLANMVRRKASEHALSVAVLLNEAQRASASGHLRYANVMWDLIAEDADGTLQQLVFGMKLFMTVSEVRILATFR